MSQNDVLKYVAAKLAADKVDVCTEQIRSCLTSENACGEDYSGCIGLDTETIADLCPVDKLTACADKHDSSTARDYVNQIAMGLSLQIDNNMLTTCQNALNTAMTNVCGDTEGCSKFALDKNIGTTSLEYKVCQMIVTKDDNGNVTSIDVNEGLCKDSAEQITKQEMGLDTMTASTVSGIGSIQSGSSAWGFGVATIFGGFGGGRSDSQTNINFVRYSKYTLKPGEVSMYTPVLKGKIDWGSQIDAVETVDSTTGLTTVHFQCAGQKKGTNLTAKTKVQGKLADSKCDENLQNIVDSLNNSIDRMIKTVEADTKVQYCMQGRDIQTTDGKKIGTSKSNKDGTGARFPNLTSTIRQTIANQVYNTAINNYNEKLAELEEKRDEDYLNISSKYEEVAAENDEKQLQQRLATNCQSLTRDNSTWNYKETISASYSESSKICTKVTRTQKCESTTHAASPGRRTCTKWANPEEKTEQLRM